MLESIGEAIVELVVRSTGRAVIFAATLGRLKNSNAVTETVAGLTALAAVSAMIYWLL